MIEPALTYSGHAKSYKFPNVVLAWSPDGRYIASGDGNSIIHVWRPSDGQQIAECRGHSPSPIITGVASLCWSPDSTEIVSGGSDATAKIWKAASGELRLTYTGHNHPWNPGVVASVAWSFDGTLIASGGYGSPDSSIHIWTPMTGKTVHRLRSIVDETRSIAWAPDSRRLAIGGSTARVQVVDARHRNSLGTFYGQQGTVLAVDWSPNGASIASAGSEQQPIYVWEPEKRGWFSRFPIRCSFTGHKEQFPDGRSVLSTIFDLAWSPNGSQIASVGGSDEYIRVWDPVTGSELTTIKSGVQGNYNIAWSPDGHRIAVSGMDRLIRIWDVG